MTCLPVSPARRVIQTRVPPEGEGVRLDHFLRTRFTYRSRSDWQRTIRRGEILLNSLLCRPSRVLHSGDLITYNFPDTGEPCVRTDFHILLETPDFLAVDKPGQLPVHPAGRFFRNTLSEILRPDYGEVYPVNRLDRETSGIVLFARSSSAASRLSSLFAGRSLHKTYLAVVHGVIPRPFDASGYLSADESSPVRKKRRFTFAPPPGCDSESAFTSFRPLCTGDALTLVEAVPSTGRLHQIRATLCSLGFPLLGDKLYGLDDSLYLRYIDDSLSADDLALLQIPRQALHAFALSFRSPFDGAEISLRSPLPPELASLPFLRECPSLI